MKNKINNFLSYILICGLLASCNDDDNTGHSIINYSPVTVTLSSPSPDTFDESAIDPDNPSTYQITIEATIEAPQPVDAIIDVTQVGGTANASDFEINGAIRIAAGQTSGSATVDILKTGDIEGDETLFIGASTSRANFDVIPFSHSVNITNDHINDTLDLTMDWAGSYNYSAAGGALDVTVDYCAADFDLILYTDVGGYVGYVLGTASCPEEGSLSGLADGSYFLVVDLYDNPFSTLNTGQPLPITLNISQEYFPETETTIIHNGYTTDSSSGLQAIATLDVVGGYNYTVTPL